MNTSTRDLRKKIYKLETMSVGFVRLAAFSVLELVNHSSATNARSGGRKIGSRKEEKFKIIDDKDVAICDACFTEVGLTCFPPAVSANVLKRLLTGTYRIKKAPWEAQYGEIYFAPLICSSKKCAKFYKTADDLDKRAYRHGLMCKTQEQAEELSKLLIKTARQFQGFDEEEQENE